MRGFDIPYNLKEECIDVGLDHTKLQAEIDNLVSDGEDVEYAEYLVRKKYGLAYYEPKY